MSIAEQFRQATENSKNLAERPSNENLLKMYALYKQATEGDVAGEKPVGFDFKAIAKYEAWQSVQGKSKEDAMQEYVTLINALQ